MRNPSRMLAAMAIFLVFWQGSAVAGGLPVLDSSTPVIGETVEEAVSDVVDTVEATTSVDASESLPVQTEKAATDANAPSSPSSGSSASASGHTVDADLLDGDLAVISGSEASSGSDGCSAHATVLSLLGGELMGADAQCSPGGTVTQEVGLLTETCEASGGVVCMALLYGRAATSDDASSRSSSSDTSIATACVGGETMHPMDGCQGPVLARIANTHSDANYDKTDGSAEASESSMLAEVCLGGEDPATGKCTGLGINLLSSEAGAEASRSGSSQSSSSYILRIEAMGEDQATVGEDALDLPPSCYADPTLCAALNQTTNEALPGGGSVNQEGVSAVLDGVIDVSAENTAASAQYGGRAARTPPTAGNGTKGNAPGNIGSRPANRPAINAGPPGPALATTGTDILAALLLALTLIGVGIGLFVWTERGVDI
ncbi:MAG TPA: hypothetical protein VNC78_09980 [Actinomycetota bacterium]|nr:hypothetical protein [Actinomycetota bacterium]